VLLKKSFLQDNFIVVRTLNREIILCLYLDHDSKTSIEIFSEIEYIIFKPLEV
jgi:hypothetical protein